MKTSPPMTKSAPSLIVYVRESVLLPRLDERQNLIAQQRVRCIDRVGLRHVIVLGLQQRANAATRARAHRALELIELLDHPGRVELGGVGHERDRALDQAWQRRALDVKRAVGAVISGTAFALLHLDQV